MPVNNHFHSGAMFRPLVVQGAAASVFISIILPKEIIMNDENQLNHRDYYVARAAASRDLAGRAMNPKIASIHAEFATRYETLAGQPDQPKDFVPRASQAT